METNKPTPLAPDFRGNYPHMARADAPVWEAWLDQNQNRILEVYYDVALGGVTIDDPDVDDGMRDGWKYTTAVKIDAVAVTDTENLVIEVKPVARLGALGQALGYTILLDADPLNGRPNTPVVVATHASSEVLFVAERLGVRVALITSTR